MTEATTVFDPADFSDLVPRATMDGERLIAVFTDLVEPLGAAFPPSSEVILHDFARLPNSVVAVHGDVTGRKVGDPATNFLLERLARGDFSSLSNYEIRLPDGRQLQSSTMIIRDVAGNPVAALCINTDVSVWAETRKIADAMLSRLPVGQQAAGNIVPHAGVQEWFPKSVDELAEHLMAEAIRDIGGDKGCTRKEQKVEVVQLLQSKGFFMLKESIDTIASRLDVSKFTIYNYLNEINKDAAAS